ncbi:DUF397 domain-containing protein [Actinomadura madurae]
MWRKAARSTAEGDNCVEVADVSSVVTARTPTVRYSW